MEWVRDPECSIPLEIIKGDQGRIYARAHVRRLSRWSFWKKRLDASDQMYQLEMIPWRQRRRYQSLIKNTTPEDVTIHAYVMRMSQWTATLEFCKAAADAEGVETNVEAAGSMWAQRYVASSASQIVSIPSGCSHWFEIPRVGAGFWPRRKVMAVIFTTVAHHEGGGRELRYDLDVVALSTPSMFVLLTSCSSCLADPVLYSLQTCRIVVRFHLQQHFLNRSTRHLSLSLRALRVGWRPWCTSAMTRCFQ